MHHTVDTLAARVWYWMPLSSFCQGNTIVFCGGIQCRIWESPPVLPTGLPPGCQRHARQCVRPRGITAENKVLTKSTRASRSNSLYVASHNIEKYWNASVYLFSVSHVVCLCEQGLPMRNDSGIAQQKLTVQQLKWRTLLLTSVIWHPLVVENRACGWDFRFSRRWLWWWLGCCAV
jgi:hypothetical protein